MPNGDAQQLRARDCLNVSKSTSNEANRTILEDVAADLEAEAKKIDAEEARIGPNDAEEIR